MILLAKVYVNKKETETDVAAVERAIKKFNKEVEKEKILKTVIDRRYYVSKSEKRKAKEKAGRRKQLKQMYTERRLNNLY